MSQLSINNWNSLLSSGGELYLLNNEIHSSLKGEKPPTGSTPVQNHDYQLNSANNKRNIEIYKSIMDNDAVLMKIANFLKDIYSDTTIDPRAICAELKRGIAHARQKFLDQFSDETIDQLLALPNSPSLGTPNPRFFKEMRDLCRQSNPV